MDPVAEPPPGRRERKKQQTREALRAAALHRFTREGFSATRVADIAADADVSEATFFRYFASKEEVALAGLVARMNTVVDAVEARPDGELPLEACRAVLASEESSVMVPDAEMLYELQVLATSAALAGHYFKHVTRVTQRLTVDFRRRLGSVPGDLAPHLLANGAVIALYATFQAWMEDPTGRHPTVLAAEAFEALAHGLEPDPSAP